MLFPQSIKGLIHLHLTLAKRLKLTYFWFSSFNFKFLNIMQEFKSKLHQLHQQKIKFKVVDRIYSFELPIYHGKRKYLKVKYDGHLPPIDANLKGKSFSHVIGTSWSL